MRRRISLIRELVFAVLGVFAVLPLWIVRHPPIQDLPQHLAAIRVLSDYSDPKLGFAHWFELSLGSTQYLTYYLAAKVLAIFLGVSLANGVLLSLSIGGLAYALRALLRALGRDEDLALFCFPLLWNAHLILGFVNFIAAIPLVLWGLSLAVRQRLAPSRRRAVLLALLLVLTFYTHVVPFAFLAAGVLLLSAGAGVRASLSRAMPLLPAALCVSIWFATSPAGRSVSAAIRPGGQPRGLGVRPLYTGWSDALRQAPDWLTDVLVSESDDKLLVVWLLLVVLTIGVTVGARAGDDRASLAAAERGTLARRLGVLPALAALLYFVTPSSYDWIWPINARFPLLALIFLIPVMPAPRGAIRLSVLGAAVVLALLSFTEVTAAFRKFEKEEVGELDQAIAAIPPGQKVAGLIWQRHSRYVKFAPFIHAVAWYQVEKGGAVMFTFADFPQSPFKFKPENRPPKVAPRWEWEPGRVDPARDLGFYDYVLTRGDPGRLAQAGVFEQIFRGPRWAVWKRRSAVSSADRGQPPMYDISMRRRGRVSALRSSE